jgi:hypothetical protein
LLVEKRQGQHQLWDEVDFIHLEVEELFCRPASPYPKSSASVISDVSSSPSPPRQVLDFNSPPGPVEVDQEQKVTPNM